MELLRDVWRRDYLLPPGVTWGDMERLADSERPRPLDLVVALPLALGFVALRYAFERFVAPSVGACLGVRNRLHRTAAPSSQLEWFYTQRSTQPTQGDIAGLVPLCGRTQKQIETWFRLRRNQDRPCRSKKFAEAAWRFVFYLTAFLAGLRSLIDKPWFWDLRECWKQYPVQPMHRAHYWYYMLELGFYGSLLLRISADVRRKDFKEQVLHHLATTSLLGFSYCANYVRIGTVVMLLHDSADVLLESAKMFNYGTGWKKTCDALFVAFAAVFLVTRLVIFPSKVIHTTLVLSMDFFQPFFGYYLFNALLMVLLALHVFWAALILRMVYKFLKGELQKDERSDDESETEQEEDEGASPDDHRWERRKDALNSKLAALSNTCVLNNFSHHRSSAAARTRKAQ